MRPEGFVPTGRIVLFLSGTFSGFRNTKGFKGFQMAQRGLLRDVWDFLRVRKAWWMLPVVVMLILMGSLVIASQVPYLAPFIYALF